MIDPKLHDAMLQRVRYHVLDGELARVAAAETVDYWISCGFEIGTDERARFIDEAEVLADKEGH